MFLPGSVPRPYSTSAVLPAPSQRRIQADRAVCHEREDFAPVDRSNVVAKVQHHARPSGRP